MLTLLQTHYLLSLQNPVHANQLSSESEQHAFNNEPFSSKIWQCRDAAIGGSVRVGTLCEQMFPMQSGVSAEVVTSAEVVISFPPSPTLSPLTTSVLLQGTALGAQGVITAWSAPRKICSVSFKSPRRS